MLLPRVADYLPFLRRFVGDDTVDSVINAGGLALLFALFSFIIFVIRAPHQIDAARIQEITRLERELSASRSDVADKERVIRESQAKLTYEVAHVNLSEYGAIPILGREGTTVLFWGSVRNVGQPSVVIDWRVTAILSDGSRVMGETVVLKTPAVFSTNQLSDGKYAHRTVSYESLLSTKCSTPLPQGDLRSGFILAAFLGRKIPLDTKYEVTFKDVYGNDYASEVPAFNGVSPRSDAVFQGEDPQDIKRTSEEP